MVVGGMTHTYHFCKLQQHRCHSGYVCPLTTMTSSGATATVCTIATSVVFTLLLPPQQSTQWQRRCSRAAISATTSFLPDLLVSLQPPTHPSSADGPNRHEQTGVKEETWCSLLNSNQGGSRNSCLVNSGHWPLPAWSFCLHKLKSSYPH